MIIVRHHQNAIVALGHREGSTALGIMVMVAEIMTQAPRASRVAPTFVSTHPNRACPTMFGATTMSPEYMADISGVRPKAGASTRRWMLRTTPGPH